MSASEDHASAVASAIAEAETLAGEAERNLKDAVEQAAGAVGAIVDDLIRTVNALAAQAEAVTMAAQNTLSAAETHVSATQSAGQGTLGHVLAAQEACQLAANNALGVQEFTHNLLGAVAETHNIAVNSLMSLVGQLDEGITGAKTTVGHLGEARDQIAAAQNPQ